MSDSLTRFVPEFDEDAERFKLAGFKLAGFDKEQLIDIVIRAYKIRRVVSKELDEAEQKLKRIGVIIDEPSQLAQMPGVPSADELRRKFEE